MMILDWLVKWLTDDSIASRQEAKDVNDSICRIRNSLAQTGIYIHSEPDGRFSDIEVADHVELLVSQVLRERSRRGTNA